MATRYGIRSGCRECGPNYVDHDLIPVPDGMPDEPGFVVLLSEHRTAIAEAERRAYSRAVDEGVPYVWDQEEVDDLRRQGAERERAGIRAAVLKLRKPWQRAYMDTDVLAVIDARGKSVPRVLTADDPEPAVGSVVLLPEHPGVTSTATRGTFGWWRDSAWPVLSWRELLNGHGSVTLIHDAGGE